jgi:hypothetical protein
MNAHRPASASATRRLYAPIAGMSRRIRPASFRAATALGLVTQAPCHAERMSSDSTRAMTFQARPTDVFAALLEAAKRTGFQYLAGDVSMGRAMFTSGRHLLMAGEKVNAQWAQVAPGNVQVTLTPAKFGVGWASRRSSGVDRFSDELNGLLPHAG